MPNAVTPARRRRTDDDIDGSSGTETDGSPRSGGSKRVRLNNPDSDDEVSESGHAPLLPDSYRRSPRNRHRAVDHDSNDGPRIHQPGSIVRISLKDFVTYTQVQFNLGPNLNMIIGPNGTGKSTLVCAICLGLGWPTYHLGRAKELGEFVKHGQPKAEIEIELAADPERHRENQIVVTKITKQGNKAEYFINEKRSNRKGVQELASSFSIQVDNLCQFLPQDRVVEFAALSPVDLLAETQRAAAPEYMTQWHNDLKKWRSEQKKWQDEQHRAMEVLKNMENRQRLQEADVNRFLEHAKTKERMVSLEKLRPKPKFEETAKRLDEIKQQEEEAKEKLQELQSNLEPNLRAVNDKRLYIDKIEMVLTQRQQLVQRSEANAADMKTKITTSEEEMNDCDNEEGAQKNAVKETRKTIARHEQDLQRFEKAMEKPPPEYDFSEMNERIREKTRQLRELETKAREITEARHILEAQYKKRQEIIKTKEREKEGLQSQAGKQANKLRQASAHASAAWEWIQNNRSQFQGKVFGPPLVECRVKDPQHANAIESVIPDSEMLAFTVTSQNDFKLLQSQVYGTLKLTDISIRNICHPLSTFKRPHPVDQLRQLGLESYLLDHIDGPEPVLAMLCDNRNLHLTGFTSRDISEAQFEGIKRTNISSFVTSTQTYNITRRRDYGDQASSTRVVPIRKAKFFTDIPVDRRMEQDIAARITEANSEIEEIKMREQDLKRKEQEIDEQNARIAAERQEIEEDKKMKQKATSEFHGLPVKHDMIKTMLDDAQAQIADFVERVRNIRERRKKACLARGQHALDYAKSVEALRGLHVQLFEAEILRIEATSDRKQMQEQHAEEERQLEQKQKDVEELIRIRREIRARAKQLKKKCDEISENLTESDEKVLEDIMDYSSEQLETEIQLTQARLDLTLGIGNENTLHEFEKRARSIDEKKTQLQQVELELEKLEDKISEVRQRWEPELDDLVANISGPFAENFARIHCAGEVAVHKDEDFEQWAIQVKVKFRENESLSILDSHRQSGGERAVSTIFYLLALQSMARAPFRVVDEINQGMDPRNERMVHALMLDIAWQEQTSQYFLITPKLLQGLHYHDRVKVHCIASGENMPANHDALNFAPLAREAVALHEAGAI